jgi:hypothetical protein
MPEDPLGDESTPPIELHLVPRDTSFEHALDEGATKPEPVHEGDGNEIPGLGGERRPIIPGHLRTWAGIKSTAGRHADAARFHTLFHVLRLPMYLVTGVFWAYVGVVKVTGLQIRWWWLAEQSYLRSKAVVEGNSPEYRALLAAARRVRRWRGTVLAAEAFAILLALVLLAALAPWWAWLIVAAVAMPPLAHKGRPDHRPIVQSAVTTPLIRKISTDAIVRAYESAGQCSTDPKKPADHLGFGSTMTRDALDKGSQVVVVLPYGGTFAKVVNAKTVIASGLDVLESQVYFTRDKKSERSHTLRVLDTDPLAEPAGRTPLLDLKQRSIWHKFPLGLDQFGRRVAFCLLWYSMLIGAQPRKGKTFTGRLIALWAALDPFVKITIIDGRMSPDWLPFRYVAHRYVRGTFPTRDGDPVEQALDALREIRRWIDSVNEELAALTVRECPEGKLTEHLHRTNPKLRVWLLVMEEFQVYFELADQKKNKEFAQLSAEIQAMGPAAGVVLASLTQKPSGIGSGQDLQRLFNRYRDNHQLKFGLRCANRDVSNAILGNEAYGEGYDCSGLPLGDEYRGVGILYGLTDEAPTVRTYLADGEDAEAICLAARKLREKHRTLSGYALGVELDEPESDVVADLLEVMGGDPGLWWEAAAERLAGHWPMRHADATAESVSAACRGRGVPSVNVNVGGRVLKGCRKAALELAMRQR